VFDEKDIIHSYTRAEALKDGVLVDVSEAAKSLGFLTPVAFTQDVHGNHVQPSNVTRPEDAQERITGILTALRAAHAREVRTRTLQAGDSVIFRLPLPAGAEASRAPVHYLKALLGPGDAGEPVVTVCEVYED
jgi:hypothetical protein